MMKTIYNAATYAYQNLPLILATIAVVAGIVLRVKQFLKKSKEEQQAILKEQVDNITELMKKQMLSLVSKAEKEWGSGTGTIKKSFVWELLTAQYAKLTQFVEDGNIQKETIDSLIEDAVTELNKQKEENTKIAAAVEKTS